MDGHFMEIQQAMGMPTLSLARIIQPEPHTCAPSWRR